jgi:hypothetical protein
VALGLPANTPMAALKVHDNFATTMAEVTFSTLHNVRHTLRSLSASKSEFVLGLKVDTMNVNTLDKKQGVVCFAPTRTYRRRWDPLTALGVPDIACLDV